MSAAYRHVAWSAGGSTPTPRQYAPVWPTWSARIGPHRRYHDLIAIDAEHVGAAAGSGNRSRVRVERTQDTELPIAVDVVHIDEVRDYQSSTATVRKQVGRSESVTTFSLPIVLTIEQAQEIGQRVLREIWQGREAYDLKLPAGWLRLEPTDLVDVPVDGITRQLLVTAVTYGRPGLVLVRGIATDGGVPEAVTRLARLEAERGSEWAAVALAEQRMAEMLADRESEHRGFAYWWRPGGMYLSLYLWLQNTMLTPVLFNGILKLQVPMIPWQHLIAFTALYCGL